MSSVTKSFFVCDNDGVEMEQHLLSTNASWIRWTGSIDQPGGGPTYPGMPQQTTYDFCGAACIRAWFAAKANQIVVDSAAEPGGG